MKLEASDEFLKTRVKSLPEEKVAGTHHTEEGLNRRLPLYHKHNTMEGIALTTNFFEENGIEVFKLKTETITEDEVFEAIKAYIEKVNPIQIMKIKKAIERDIQEVLRSR